MVETCFLDLTDGFVWIPKTFAVPNGPNKCIYRRESWTDESCQDVIGGLPCSCLLLFLQEPFFDGTNLFIGIMKLRYGDVCVYSVGWQ